MFEGSYPLTLDAKGRLTIPLELRASIEEVCGGHLTLSRHFAPCLRLYPRPEWDKWKTFLVDKLPLGLEGSRRLIIGSANSMQMDAAGRILISPLLRRAAKLDRKVVLLCDVSRVEIWDEDTLTRHWDDQADAGMPEMLTGVFGA